MDVDSFETCAAEGGLELHLLRTDKYKAVHVTLALTRPLDAGTAARALLTDLLTRGTAEHPSLAALAARCEALYDTDLHAYVTAYGADQSVNFGVTTIADRYAGGQRIVDGATRLLAQVVHAPPLVDGGFRPEHVATERANLLHAIAGLGDDKAQLALRRLLETMFGELPYARHPWGRAEEAAALVPETLRAAWTDLVRTAPARLFVVGDVEPAQAQALAAALAAGALGTLVHSTPLEARIFAPPRLMHGNWRGVQTERWHVARLSLLGKFFAARARGPHESLATDAIGAIGWYSGLAIRDLHGLVDPNIAHRRDPRVGRGVPGHERLDLARALEQGASFVMFTRELQPRRPRRVELPAGLAEAAAAYRLESVWLEDPANGEAGWFSFLERRDRGAAPGAQPSGASR